MTPKIATCCYCGTRAMLVLDRERHELVCSACGAPLHEMKALRSGHEDASRHELVKPSKLRHTRPEKVRAKKPKKRKSLSRKLFSEAFDLIEDIFD